MSNAAFFAAPSYGDGDREPARPKAVNPRTGKEQSWTRASTFAAALKNPHGIIRWKMRDLIMGLSQRPDLCRMLLAGTPIEDKAKADEIIAQAIGMMAPEAKANEGTAAHTALMRSWVHQDEPVEPEFAPLVQAFAAALREHGLTPKAAEQRVLNLAYNSMGSLDWVFEEADGAFVIGDVKTGKLDEAKREFSVQLSVYDGAEFVVHADGTVEPMPWRLAHTHAVLVHIDLEHGNAVSVYRVDLNIGRHGAGLAELNRGWAKLDPLTPYVRPVGQRAEVPEQNTVVGPIEVTEPRPASVADVTSLPEAASSPLDSAVPVSAATTVAETSPAGEDRFEHWMKLDKAPLQMELKKRGWTDDAHNRRWLARALVVIEQGWTDKAMIKKYASAKDDWSPQTGYTTPAPEQEPEIGGAGVPHEPTTPPAEPLTQGPSTETLAHAIAGANSIGAIEALRSEIVERRGDQAWTEALVVQARNRAYELGELPISEAAARAVFEQILHAPNQEALKNLWVRTTIGGSCPERWTRAMTDAGTQQLAAIAAALPTAPANPFGS